MARTIAKISFEVQNLRVNQKLLSIYGGLKGGFKKRYICRMEIFKCVHMNLYQLDAKIVSNFVYQLFTQMNQFISDGIHYLSNNAKKTIED